MNRRIGFVIHPGFQFLDVVGPLRREAAAALRALDPPQE